MVVTIIKDISFQMDLENNYQEGGIDAYYKK